MELPFKTPEQLLAYKTIRQLLAAKSTSVFSVTPDQFVISALQLMQSQDAGFLVVLDQGELAGVVSERDCARKVLLAGKRSDDTPVRDIMTTPVITVSVADTVPHCMALMTAKRIRHLPVVEGGRVLGVLSVHDLLQEVISHHERLIREMEFERIAILNSGGSSY